MRRKHRIKIRISLRSFFIIIYNRLSQFVNLHFEKGKISLKVAPIYEKHIN